MTTTAQHPAAEMLAPPPKRPAGPAPGRQAGSVRRTSTIDIDWPEGRGGIMRAVGRARDILTPEASDAPIVLAEDAIEAMLGADRSITSLTSVPQRTAIAQLVGSRAGGRLRGAIASVLPEERQAGSPLYLLLDDLAGASLIAPWAWSRWDPSWAEQMAAMKADPNFAQSFDRENICTGLRTGSSGLSLTADGVDAGLLRDPADPQGWHAFPETAGPAMRRARRIDVTVDDVIRIDAHFQDSATTPEGPRSALHEYRLRATADPVSLALLSVEPEARVLPFAECPLAADNATLLIGTPLSELRDAVLAMLKGPLGCTHLNDALRALAEVPMLAAQI